MKRFYNYLILVIVASIMIAPVVEAGRKVAKAGKIKEAVFTDAAYGFSIAMNSEWKAKVKKAKNPFRLILTQKNFLIPSDYKDAPDYTKTPRIVVFADTTSMSVGAVLDSLLSETYDSEQKSTILKEFDILHEQDLIPRRKKRFTLNGQKAVVWKAKALYIEEVATSASSIGGKRVEGSYGGAIIGVKKGDLLLLFHVMCEFQYFNDIYNQTLEFVNSIKWAEEAS